MKERWVEVSPEQLSGAECDDAADRIVGRDAHRHAVTGDDLDAEAPHPAAQLGEHFVTRVALHAIESAAVHGDDGTLHID